jgi:hypothetical protein
MSTTFCAARLYACGVERQDGKTDETDRTDLNGLFRLRRYDFDKKEKSVAEGKS